MLWIVIINERKKKVKTFVQQRKTGKEEDTKERSKRNGMILGDIEGGSYG